MISTHILDTSLGQPACGVGVHLCDEHGNVLSHVKTNQDGRVNTQDFQVDLLQIGHYSLEFSIAEYFKNLNTETFFPKAVIHFYVGNLEQHYHIPLLISPFAYSTYRGS